VLFWISYKLTGSCILDIKATIEKARSEGKTAFDENTSKQILKTYGVPVVSETVASTVYEAVRTAQDIGYPVVLKGLGETLLHKTDMGLVHLNLEGESALRKAATVIIEGAGDGLQGFLVQPHISGKREFVAGIFRDPHFGPVVMFGLGGIFTEALGDVVFRIAPIDASDAMEMLSEIRSNALIGQFRGEAETERSSLVDVLVGLSRLSIDFPEIGEVDVNPLVVGSTGDVCAVDAMVALRAEGDQSAFPPPVAPGLIADMLSPQSVAFVGASPTMGKWGHLVFIQVTSGGYPGEIYLVNQKGTDIAGRKVFKKITDIQEDVDLAIVTVPAAKVPDLIPQFMDKGIRHMVLITAGFGELGEEGKHLEKTVVKMAREAGILLIGPNTMGVANPHSRFFGMGSGARPSAGSTAVIAQSGNMGVQLLAFAEQQGIGIRGFCGSGNEAMVTIEDYIEAFGSDELTRNIMLYVESIKNGRRFFEIAKHVSREKPIVLLKGGQSSVGNKAAASHTGALTTNAAIFDVACRQAGVVKVEHTMDMLDLAAAFSSLPLPKGNRVGIMTLGGGWGVVTADLCAAHHLDVPELSPELIRIFDKMLPPFWNRSNPVDIVAERDLNVPAAIIENLVKWDHCDAVIHLGILGRKFFVSRMADFIGQVDPSYTQEYLTSMKQNVDDFEENYVKQMALLMDKYEKPIVGVRLISDETSKTAYTVQGCRYGSVFFPSPERAVKAIASMYGYNCFLRCGRPPMPHNHGIGA
jgi:acyl-CoA synthetase (NDP forming)